MMVDENGTAATVREVALAYLQRGLSIFPLVPRTKRPLVKIEAYLRGEQRATEANVERWWTEQPDAGVAIVTGTPSGLVVVDVDPRNGGNVEQTARDCPSDLAAQTGGGGLHLFCRHPGGRVPCGRTSRPGVDRKGDRGYVVAAPSIHPDTGEPYRWLREGEPGELPAWTLESPATRPAEAEQREPWIAATLAHPENCAPGSQDETLTRLAWWAAKHQEEDIALAILTSWAARLRLSRPSEPWTEEHVKAKLDSAYAKRANEPQSFATTLTGEGGGVARPKRREFTPEQAIAKVIEACRSAKERAREKSPEVDWIAPLVLPRGTLVDLHGDPKAGKSTLVAHLARAIVDGVEFFGQPTKKSKVLWFTEQPRPTFAPLLKSAGLYEHPDLLVLHHHEVMAVTWAERVAGLVKVAGERGAGVLVVDTFTKLAGIRGEDENKSGPVLVALDELEPAKAAGLTVLLVRHDRKAGGNAVSGGRGSNAVAGEADILYQIVKDEKKLGPNSRRLLYEGRLGEIPEKRIVTLDGGSYKLDGKAGGLATRQRSDEQQKDWELIASVLPRRHSERVKTENIIELLDGKLSKGKIEQRLSEYRAAVEKGTWIDSNSGTWGHVAPDGPLAWEGKDGRGGYWRACECRTDSDTEDCGRCDGCRADKECTARRVVRWWFVPDPACEVQFGHFGATSNSPDPGDLGSPGSSDSNGGAAPEVSTNGGQGQIKALGRTSRSSRISRGQEVRKLRKPKKARRPGAAKRTA